MHAVRISKTEILIFLLTLPFFKMATLEIIAPNIDKIIDIYKIISAIIIVIWFMLLKKSIQPVMAIIFLFFWIMLTTYIKNPKNMWNVLVDFVAIIAIFLLISCLEKEETKIVKVYNTLLYILIIINIVTLFLYKGGIYIDKQYGYEMYFLGYRNYFAIYYIPALFFSFVNTELTKKPLGTVLLVMICIYSTFFRVESATAFVGIIIFLLAYFTQKFFSNIRVSCKKVFLFEIVIDIWITIFSGHTNSQLFESITKGLNRDNTFTYRTIIWEGCLKMSAKHPILGYGYDESINYRNIIVGHAHNEYFQFLIISGIIGLLIFLYLNLSIAISIDKIENTETRKIFIATYVSLLTIFIAEVYINPILFIIYAIGMNIEKFDYCIKENLEKNIV